MWLILVVVKLAAGFLQVTCALIGPIVKDVSGLKQNLANELVYLAEPVAELLVLLRVVVKCAHGVADSAKAAPVGKTFEKRTDLAKRLLEVRVRHELLVRVLAMACDGASVSGVLLKEVEEPCHGLLVIFVALTLVNDLRINRDEREGQRRSARIHIPSSNGR